ncbi:5'/3'-nucleotidase SurE [Planosporangium flavigriseum]|uniref:5'-nucleotidase n=1 Tax=Planosporangium flavigriseum TaxID=373681 RepID=A0A8J3PK19_9ACTN|nr:5'/3'-nucleotidase SurE [Planosporangium flavigriseum]NJC65117.1 5'/3'-nucleotidase SurE [Planosporangium flavigriseum]GIG71734.1 5'/3'-nucleotidase SurE [Planosporangium flavigriseum]
MTRVLVTNDDGIDSPGIVRLAAAAHDAGLTVVVAAPCAEASGSSASITAHEEDGRVYVAERKLPDLPGVEAYAVAAPPALITLIATRGAFGDAPDLVLSGINRGANTGHAILHSGTVGAALTAAANGRSALAVSLDVGLSPAGPPHWESPARFVADLIPVLCRADSPVVLNLNAPDVSADEVRGLRRAKLASFGMVQTQIEVDGGYVRTTVVDEPSLHEPGTDAALLAEGYATVSAVCPIFEVPEVDLDGVVEAVGQSRR